MLDKKAFWLALALGCGVAGGMATGASAAGGHPSQGIAATDSGPSIDNLASQLLSAAQSAAGKTGATQDSITAAIDDKLTSLLAQGVSSADLSAALQSALGMAGNAPAVSSALRGAQGDLQSLGRGGPGSTGGGSGGNGGNFGRFNSNNNNNPSPPAPPVSGSGYRN